MNRVRPPTPWPSATAGSARSAAGPRVADGIGPDTPVVDVGDGCVLPGFVEAHGHPLMDAMVLSDRMVDIRPVTMRGPRSVVDAVRDEVCRRGADGAFLVGWDPVPGQRRRHAPGSPWVGNIDLSFPYLDTEATRIIGVCPGSCGRANYTKEQLTEIVEAYFPLGWQLACHVMGDEGVDTILDVYEQTLRAHPRPDHRLRLEHVGAMTPVQFRRAAGLGVTCSLFVDQIHYWGDVLVDGCSGPSTVPAGCRRGRLSRPGTGYRCTMTRR